MTSGLRRGELLGLQWSDLDQENQLITVNKQLSKINGELVLTTPKTQNSIRKVAVPRRRWSCSSPSMRNTRTAR